MPTQMTLTRIDLNGTAIRGLTTSEIDPGLERTLNAGGSVLDPALRATVGIKPLVRCSTRDIGTLLAQLFGGSRKIPHVPITAAGADLTLYWQSLAHGGARGAAGTNIKTTITKGLLVPTTLSNSGKEAELGFEIAADFDGTNLPILFATAQNLPGSFDLHSPALWRICQLRNGSAGSVINQIGEASIDFNVEVDRSDVLSTLYSLGSRVTGCNPRLTFSTSDCAVALAASPPQVGALAAAGGLIVYIAQYVAANPFLQTTGAIALTFAANSVWYPVGINLGKFPITIDYDVLAKGGDDVATAPLTYASGATLPGTGFTPTLFMQGPAYDNTTPVDVAGGRFDFGMQWEQRRPSTLPWSNVAVLPKRERSLQIQTADPGYYATLAGTNGRAISTSFRIFLRKMVNQSEPYGDAATEHVKLLMSAGFIEPERMSAGHGERAEPTIVVTPLGDVLAVTTGQAIS